jgi:hypothetical protein
MKRKQVKNIRKAFDYIEPYITVPGLLEKIKWTCILYYLDYFHYITHSHPMFSEVRTGPNLPNNIQSIIYGSDGMFIAYYWEKRGVMAKSSLVVPIKVL